MYPSSSNAWFVVLFIWLEQNDLLFFLFISRKSKRGDGVRWSCGARGEGSREPQLEGHSHQRGRPAESNFSAWYDKNYYSINQIFPLQLKSKKKWSRLVALNLPACSLNTRMRPCASRLTSCLQTSLIAVRSNIYKWCFLLSPLSNSLSFSSFHRNCSSRVSQEHHRAAPRRTSPLGSLLQRGSHWQQGSESQRTGTRAAAVDARPLTARHAWRPTQNHGGVNSYSWFFPPSS